jgi:hypothetical protein
MGIGGHSLSLWERVRVRACDATTPSTTRGSAAISIPTTSTKASFRVEGTALEGGTFAAE